MAIYQEDNMQQFYENKINGRLDILEDILHEQMRSICDALANVYLVRHLQAFKDIDREQRKKRGKSLTLK